MGFILKYAGNPVALLAIALVSLYAAFKWRGEHVKDLAAERDAVRRSLSMAEVELQNAASVNRGALLAARNATAEAERQAKIAADRAAKERLAWIRLDKLKKDISNVKDTSRVPDSIELVLDRLRATVDGGAPADRTHEDGDSGAAGVDLDGVPTSTGTPAETVVGEHTER